MSHLDHQYAYYYHQDPYAYEREHCHPYYHAPHHQQHPHYPSQQQATLNSDAQQDMQSQEEEVASFLLSLKHNHRSITPEPSWSDKSSASSSSATSSPLVDCHRSSFTKKPLSSSLVIPLEELIHKSNSMLVSLQDIDLVPDALFLAMAQMVPTRMTFQDRVGCYKSRAVGYLGMCCKHCGGQPGFGRYFPNSVRSLAQTTTSQTILKHIGSKCRHCPEELKRAVAELQRLQDQREVAAGRPRYGSRKVFFQRVWDRLHRLEQHVESRGEVEEEDDASSQHPETTTSCASSCQGPDDTSSSQTSSDVDEDHRTLEAWPSGDEPDKKVQHEGA